MARVKLMNFTTGQLGDIGFRQQTVRKEDGSLGQATVAYQINRTNSSNSPLQAAQRSRFRFAQVLGSALTAKGVINNFFRNSDGLRGYQAFISRNLRNGAIVNVQGTPVVDWRKLIVSTGKDQEKKINAYRSDLVSESECDCYVKLVWNYDWTCDVEFPDGYALYIVSMKIDPTGALEDVICTQPRVPMSACMADVQLPACDCCKIYHYAFFVNPYTGRWTASNYIGTCDSDCLEAYTEDKCGICNQAPALETKIEMPDECPTGCGDGKVVDKSSIMFNGDNNIALGDNPDRAIPILTACPNYQASLEQVMKYSAEFGIGFNEEADAGTYTGMALITTELGEKNMDISGLDLSDLMSAGVVDNSAALKAMIEAELEGATATVTLEDVSIQEYTIVIESYEEVTAFRLQNEDSDLDTNNASANASATALLSFEVTPDVYISTIAITDSDGVQHYLGDDTTVEVVAPGTLPAEITVTVKSSDEICSKAIVFELDAATGLYGKK